MTGIIGLRFKEVGKIYYFDANNKKFEINDFAIVETAHGLNCGKVVTVKKHFSDNGAAKELKKVVRKAEFKDIERLEKLKEKEVRAEKLFNEKIKKYHLDMKLIDVEYTFDGGKILFYFTADGRVDFRDLVKELAGVLKLA